MKYGERALEQLLAAAIGYDGVAPGTGERFLAQVDQLVHQIEMFPEAGVSYQFQNRAV